MNNNDITVAPMMKKAWTVPTLEVLNVKETEFGFGGDGSGFWEFLNVDGCWERSFVNPTFHAS